jgi:Cu(I)/Ag(I) efflux system membrane fusion protein
MKTVGTIATSVAISLATLPVVSLAASGTAKFDKAMGPIVAEYETIHGALSGDSTKGVARSAKRIVKLAASLDPKTVQGKHAPHFEQVPRKIRDAAVKLSKAREISEQRAAFKELSRPLAMWATISRPAGINVVYCSMARGSWLQKEKKIRNPYYGAKMLRCGEVVAGRYKGESDGHMKHHKH